MRVFALATDSELRRAVNCQRASLAKGYFEEVFGYQPIVFPVHARMNNRPASQLH
jgi:hypothetical protein